MRARRRVPVPGYAAATLLAAALALTGCAGTDPDADRASAPAPSSSTRSSSTPSSPTPPSPTSSSSGSATASPRPTATPSSPSPVGSATDPKALEAGRDLLRWTRVPGSVDDTVTLGGGASLRVDEARTRAVLTAGRASTTVRATAREQVADTLLDGRWAVVVLQDRQETRPSSATVVDLRGGRTFVVDGSSAVPTVNGGTWALGEGRLLHATTDRGAYCIASVDLATRAAELGWCAPRRTGFNAARITPAGDTLLTFDDSRPVACRSAVRLAGTDVSPLPGVEDCKAFESLALAGGAIWSVIPHERNVEAAHVFARTRAGGGESWLDLGPATAGTLTWCGDAAYFARDPQRDGDDASLMRWSADRGLDVVYESPGGQAFLTAPRCGGDTLTVTALAQSGDEQVSAPLG
jgi:hypothetical protein